MDDFERNIVETQDETDKKCPQCGGVMKFHPETGNTHCPYCDYEETIEFEPDEESTARELDFSEAEFTANKNWGMETKTVLCEACGAESIYDALQTSAVCPFCGSNQVMEAQASDTIAPGGVVPFQINDSQAAELFKLWIKKKWFCPKLAKESVKPKKFKGIYLPYWTFDTRTSSTYRGEYGIQRTTRNRKGETKVVVHWHHTSGSHTESIDDELVLASSTHDYNLLKGLEPFQTEKNMAYKPEYIAGFVAERYSLGLKDAWEHAKTSIRSKLRSHIETNIRSRHHADYVRNLSVNTSFSDITYKYLLLPIWISNFKYKDKVYQFMVNGQTGKVSGRTPISVPKVIITVLAILAIIGLIVYLYD